MFEVALNPHLFLIGYRGSGKTTVGESLGGLMNRPFVDADVVLEADAEMTIRDIFAAEGEAGFRNRETATLRKLTAGPEAIIATGGGIVLRPENRELLRSGFVVWLTAEPELLWHRIQIDPTTGDRRPNLTASGGLDEVRSVLLAREPLYRETAHLTVDASRSPELVAADILPAWEAWLGSRRPTAPY